MASIEELEAEAKEAEVVDEEFEKDDEGYEDLIHKDILEAFALLAKCQHLMAYLSEPDFVKGLLKRDRDSMSWLAEQIGDYMDDVLPHYEEEEKS